jgi:hypothetical protein
MAHALCLNRSQGSVSQLRNPGAAMVTTLDRTDGWVRRCRSLNDYSFCGPAVPLSSGRTYSFSAPVCPTITTNSAYRACIASPSTCTSLYVPPSMPSRMRVARAQLSSHKVTVAASVRHPPWMAATVLTSRRACAGDTRVEVFREAF